METRGTSRLLIDGAEASPTLASFCAENRVSLGEIPFLLQHLPSVRIALPNGVMLLRFDVLQWSCESTTKNLIRYLAHRVMHFRDLFGRRMENVSRAANVTCFFLLLYQVQRHKRFRSAICFHRRTGVFSAPLPSICLSSMAHASASSSIRVVVVRSFCGIPSRPNRTPVDRSAVADAL